MRRVKGNEKASQKKPLEGACDVNMNYPPRNSGLWRSLGHVENIGRLPRRVATLSLFWRERIITALKTLALIGPIFLLKQLSYSTFLTSHRTAIPGTNVTARQQRDVKWRCAPALAVPALKTGPEWACVTR